VKLILKGVELNCGEKFRNKKPETALI